MTRRIDQRAWPIRPLANPNAFYSNKLKSVGTTQEPKRDAQKAFGDALNAAKDAVDKALRHCESEVPSCKSPLK